MESNKNKLLRNFLNLFVILAGNSISALAVVTLVIPNDLPTGGSTGIGLFMNKAFGINMSIVVFIFNLLVFILGAVVLGKKFALTTILSTFYYPFILNVFQRTINIGVITEDKLLATIFAGLLMGVSLGMVFRVGASTGGTDIPPLVINKLFGVPVSVGMYGIDLAVILLQVFNHRLEMIMYGVLLVFMYTIVIDKVLLLGTKKVQVKIISKKQQEICDIVMNTIDRGVTLLHSKSGYYKTEQEVVLTVVSKREYIRLIKTIQKVDPSAFIIVSEVNEVKGRGFTIAKNSSL